MAWIESHTVLMRHRKIAQLALALKIRRSHVVGHLHALWHSAMEQQEDGDLSGWSDEFIAECADYAGEASEFVKLLQICGLLDGKLLHDWPDYAGNYLRGKYAKNNRQRLVDIWLMHGSVYGNQSHIQQKSNQHPTEIQPTSNQHPSTPYQPNQPTNQTKKENKKEKVAADPAWPAGFEKFWKTWPKHDRKTNKKAALKIWQENGLEKKADEVIRSLQAWKCGRDWTAKNGEYIPFPTSWLTACRYESFPDPSVSSKETPDDGFVRARLTVQDFATSMKKPIDDPAVVAEWNYYNREKG